MRCQDGGYEGVSSSSSPHDVAVKTSPKSPASATTPARRVQGRGAPFGTSRASARALVVRGRCAGLRPSPQRFTGLGSPCGRPPFTTSSPGHSRFTSQWNQLPVVRFFCHFVPAAAENPFQSLLSFGKPLFRASLQGRLVSLRRGWTCGTTIALRDCKLGRLPPPALRSIF